MLRFGDKVVGNSLWYAGFIIGLNHLLLQGIFAQPILANRLGSSVSLIDANNLKGASLFDLAFTTNGTAWIATSDGLWRYDGYHWMVFGTNQGLPSRYVRTVTIDNQGLIWIGTDKGAATFDGHHFSLAAPPSQLAGPSVRRIKFFPDAGTWFCSDKWPNPEFAGGLTVWHDGQWRIYRKKDGLPSDHVYNCFQDSRGRRFALTDHGVAQQDGDGWRTVIEEPIWELVESPSMGVCGFSAAKMYHLQGDAWQVTEYPKIVRSGHAPKSVYATSQGEILCYGFGRWTGEGLAPAGLINPQDINPEAIRQAPDGAVWCVDTAQLIRWEPHPRTWLEYLNLPAPRFCLNSNEVIFIDSYSAYHLRDTNFVPVPELVGDPERMEMDNAGCIWIWSSTNVYSYSDALRSFSARDLGMAKIEGQTKDGRGRLWFHGIQTDGRRSISTYDGNRWRTKLIQGSPNQPFTAATGDPESGIWLTAEDSAGRTTFVHANLDKTQSRPWRSPSGERTNARLMVDHEANMWVYGDWGLYCAPRLGETGWQRMEQMDATMVVQAISGPEGAWFVFSSMQGGQSGFGRYWRGNWAHIVTPVPLFMERTGTGSRSVYAGACRLEDGTYCFGGFNSFHIVPLGNIKDTRKITLPQGNTMPISILKTRAGTIWLQAHRPDTLSCVMAFRSDGIPPSSRITVSPSQVPMNGLWQVRVQGLERFAVDSERKEFQYSWRFDDRPWTPFQVLPSDGLSTIGLKPGLHRFQVRARDEGTDVQVEPTEATLSVISPPWQEQTWFKVLFWTTMGMILLLTLIASERARKLALVNTSLSAEIEVRRKAEIQLQQAQAELRYANQQLETRVRERTDDLAVANKALRQEISERQRIEAEQRALEAKMQQTQKLESLGVMAGGIAHDFNNMLTTILGNANLALMDLATDARAREYIQEINAASKRAADLCGQMLAYSGRGRFVIEPVHLSALVRDTANMIELSIGKKARLKTNLTEDLPFVEADVIQLRQVIMNLVINASEAIDRQEGTIVVSTRMMRCDRAFLETTITPDAMEEGDYVLLEVSDDGCGMDAGTLKKIFDPFFTTRFTGRGLGLPVVLGIIRGHHGTIRVQTKPHQGTTFTILLPPDLKSPKQLTTSLGPANPESRELHNTILLVDDEDAVRTVAARILKRLGYTVITANDGREALDLFKQQASQIDCVLLDLTMPHMDGITTFRELQRIRPDVRAVLASGYSEQELGHQFSRDGLAAIVQKPFAIEALSEILTRILGRPPPKA